MKYRSFILPVAALVLCFLPALAPAYLVTLANYIGIYSLVVLGLVLLTGVGGMTSFGHAAFLGIGAYTTAVLTANYGLSPWVGLAAAVGVVALLAAAIGAITLRLSGHYLPLCTIAWGISIYYLFANIPGLGGHTGLQGIPPVSFFGYQLEEGSQIYYLILAFLAMSLLASRNLLDSRSGRIIRALRTSAPMAESFGANTAAVRLKVFVFSALLAGAAGWLYAHQVRFVNPTPFGLNAGIEFLFMAVVAGTGNVVGAVVGAVLITLTKQWLQSVLPALFGHNGDYEIVFFGILVVLLLQKSPAGLGPYLRKLIGSGARRLDTNLARALPEPAWTTAARTTEPLLKVTQAEKRFGGLVAVNKVSFEVYPAEIIGLIGPNGAGKSTMFNLITGVLPPSSGQFSFAGDDITGKSARQIANLGIGRTFQHVQLVPEMSVEENIALGGYLRADRGFVASIVGLDRAQEESLRAEARKLGELVGLADQLHIEAGALSLGAQRIVEIARALMMSPRLLLLDEPAAGLRYGEKQKLAELLQKLRGTGMAVLLVEHDMEFVMGLVDRLVVMEYGQTISTGTPSVVREDPRVIEAYLGAAA